MEDISFISLTMDHLSLLHQWINNPHVNQWWSEGKIWSYEEIAAKYTSYSKGYKIHDGKQKAIHPFIIQYQEQPIGYVQYYNAHDFPREGYSLTEVWKEPLSIAALDFFIGKEEFLGKGLGAVALELFLHHYVFSHYSACLVDPDKENKNAISAYVKAGFITHSDLPSIIIMIAKKNVVKNPIIIFGSSRSDGKTYEAIKAVIEEKNIPLFDLRQLNISYFDYQHNNKQDDFIPLMEQMVKHNPIILATPVYWYTMSAIMKTFMDRFSDLLVIRKDLGRRLAGKEIYLITSYSGELPRGFEDPFSQTCEYFEMEYKECLYYYTGDKAIFKKQNDILVKSFVSKIWSQAEV